MLSRCVELNTSLDFLYKIQEKKFIDSFFILLSSRSSHQSIWFESVTQEDSFQIDRNRPGGQERGWPFRQNDLSFSQNVLNIHQTTEIQFKVIGFSFCQIQWFKLVIFKIVFSIVKTSLLFLGCSVLIDIIIKLCFTINFLSCWREEFWVAAQYLTVLSFCHQQDELSVAIFNILFCCFVFFLYSVLCVLCFVFFILYFVIQFWAAFAVSTISSQGRFSGSPLSLVVL